VLTTGRPRIIHPIVDETSAIIQTYLPGDFGGEALANIIFGITNPSGKLPYSYPKYNGIIEHYDHKNSEAKNGKSNKFDAYDPEWDFGFGLSYSSFVYSDLQLSKAVMHQSDSITVSITVTNTSNRTGKEVVQLYIRDEVASDVPWGKRLRDFEKLELKANESRKITFVIASEDLTFVNSSNKRVLEPGYFEVMIDGLKTRFELK
jgi:beta-glucosidase